MCWNVFQVSNFAAALPLLQPHLATSAFVPRAASGGDAGSSSDGSTNGSSKAAAGRKKRGPPFSPVPDIDAAQLLRSLGLEGAADPAALLKHLRKLPGVRQQGVLDNAAAVVAHLLGLAVGLMQLGQMLQHCPYLFSWPPEQRAAALFGELMGVGLAAEQAVQCFIKYPEAAVVSSFAAGLAELAAILAHSQDSSKTKQPKVPAAERTAAALLQQTPSAVRLVCNAAGYLQQRAAELQQVGFTPAQVAALAWQQPELLRTDSAAKVAKAAAVLQQELGLTAAEVVSLVASRKPRWLTNSSGTLRERAAALAEVGAGAPLASVGLLALCFQTNNGIPPCLTAAGIWQGCSGSHAEENS